VLEWSDTEEKISVTREKECFGCLSCSEICPATAISHTDLPLSASYYHDRYALELTAKMGKPSRQLYVPDDEEMIVGAMKDLGVRLLSVASVLKQTLGSSLPSVGTMAGMSLDAQFSRYQPVTSLEEACAWITKTFAPAWECTFAIDNDKLTVSVDKCYIRTLCRQESIALGGDLCTLFYNYLAGYFSKVAKKRPRLVESTPGEKQCVYNVKLYG
jgi:ferredoxin